MVTKALRASGAHRSQSYHDHVVMLFLIGTFGLNFPIFTSTMAVKVFHSDAKGFGLLSSIMAMEGSREPCSPPSGTNLDSVPYSSALLFSVLDVHSLRCPPGYWWSAGSLVVIGVAALTVTNTTNSMMQLSAEPAMRGRVMTLRLAVALGGTPIGAPTSAGSLTTSATLALGMGAASRFTAAIVAVRILTERTEAIPENQTRPI